MGGLGSCWFKLLQMQRWFYRVCKEPYPDKGRNWLLFQISNARSETWLWGPSRTGCFLCSEHEDNFDFSYRKFPYIRIVPIFVRSN